MFPYVGSLLMQTRDEAGRPYQVCLKLRPGGHGIEDLVRDKSGHVLAWQSELDGAPRLGERGPRVRRVPAEVAASAERWLAEQDRNL